jgi:predicted dehydrogenase
MGNANMKNEKEATMQQNRKISRREFIGGTVATVAAFTIVPSRVLGGPRHIPPSEKLNIACIGVGGQGRWDIKEVSSENIVALCDVDELRAAETFEKFPNTKVYRDFREMLEKENKNIDAVVIATPDHTHAPAAIRAMKMGKHVYVEKPMAHTIYEARKMTEMARKKKVVTQVGNQGHAGEGLRLTYEFIHDGAIGTVREVHVWSDRPIWPKASIDLRTPRRYHRRWTGICGSALLCGDHIIRLMCRLIGAGGGILAVVLWEIWQCITPTLPFSV